MRFTEADVDKLLEAWPRLRRQLSARAGVCRIAGPLEFEMSHPNLPTVHDCYDIRIDVPLGPTEFAPEVFEVGQRIPSHIDHHVNSNGTLCLGSPWSVRRTLGDPPNLVRFVERSVVPFLYAATWREQGRQGYPFSELAHGKTGLLDDYETIFGVRGSRAVLRGFDALAKRWREANKLPCPCGCGYRLGRCNYRFRLDRLRRGLTRPFYRELRDQFTDAYPPTRLTASPRKKSLLHHLTVQGAHRH